MVDPLPRRGLSQRRFKLWLFGIFALMLLVIAGGAVAAVLYFQSWADGNISDF